VPGKSSARLKPLKLSHQFGLRSKTPSGPHWTKQSSKIANHRSSRSPACQNAPIPEHCPPEPNKAPESRQSTTFSSRCLQLCFQQSLHCQADPYDSSQSAASGFTKPTHQARKQERESCKACQVDLCMRRSRASFSVFRRPHFYQRLLPQLPMPGRGQLFYPSSSVSHYH